MMARRTRIPLSRRILAAFALSTSIHLASAQTYYFTGAVTVQQAGSGYTAAQQAVCPSGYDNRCDSIGASDYCCPSGNTCSWANSAVQCCASGQTCTGWSSGNGAYQPSSYYQPETSTVYYQPTSQYYPPATTVYAAGGAGYQQTTQAYDGYNGYCSTYYAEGPNLPTTRQGDCGTVLIIAPSEGVSWVMGWVRLGVLMAGLHVLGGLVFALR